MIIFPIKTIYSTKLSLIRSLIQLQQVTEALSANNEFSEELSSLRENLLELISLTKENLETAKAENEDPLAKEYELFKVNSFLLKCRQVIFILHTQIYKCLPNPVG